MNHLEKTALDILKNPEKNQELYQKITYSLCNLADYPSYYLEKSIKKEEREEKIKELITSEEIYKQNHKKHPKKLIIVNKDKEIFTNEQKEKIENIFEEVIYTKLLNNILFITFYFEKNIEMIKVEDDKVFINYSKGGIWVDEYKKIKCQYCPRKLLTKEEAINIWPDACFHCQNKILKELDWAEFIEIKENNWYKPTPRDLEIQETIDKLEYYLKNKDISIEYGVCGNSCCSCEYKNRKAIYSLMYYSDSFDMDCGIHLSSILEDLEEEDLEKN